ncbi:diguanylate cyclase domain-containing protein [Streptomyces sp. NPDC059761]|uniref:diguanylate cyclase domain-containing protein n=1 Tax=Streptomyces sp. NPDC059761 TaxID=3346937 RepID=UPI0036651466
MDLQSAVQDLHQGRSLAETLELVSSGIVSKLGFESSFVHLVRPDGNLVVAAGSGSPEVEHLIVGKIGIRASWDRRLSLGTIRDNLHFIHHSQAQLLDNDSVPEWRTDAPEPHSENDWHPADRLFAPMYAPDRELLGVISVGRPRTGRHPGSAQREALQAYTFQSALAITNSRLRANMQRALLRLEREQEALRASEISFRQAFEYAPSGLVISELGGEMHGRMLRTNDALCRLLDRPASVLRRYSMADLVHPEDLGTLLSTPVEAGRTELRLGRRGGTYVWVSLRNSVVSDSADGPRFLLTHVEDIQDRKLRELELTHRAFHDQLTGLPNLSELEARLSNQICQDPNTEPSNSHSHTTTPAGDPNRQGVAVIFCALRGFKSINLTFGRQFGDCVLGEAGKRLSNLMQEKGTIARIGGDEFVALIEEIEPPQADEIARRIKNSIERPYHIDGQVAHIGVGTGIAWSYCGTESTVTITAARNAAN